MDVHTAVVDRIVDGETAVFLLESGGETVDQVEVAAEAVPPDGRHEGAVFEVAVDDGAICALRYRPETENERRRAAQDRFDRLSRRLGDDEDRTSP